jgi:hypothetical protein
VATSLHPIYRTDPIALERAYFLYALLQHIPIDFASHAIRIMWHVHQVTTNSTLPFEGLIMRLVGMVNVNASDRGDVQKPSRPLTKNFINMSLGHLSKEAAQ